MNAVIYARYSSDSQREESIEGQLRECREYAERNNMTIAGTYIDRALSAKTADRPEFQHMIKDSTKELFEIVLVWKLDRFSRDRYDSAHYKHILKKNGVKVVSAKEHINKFAGKVDKVTGKGLSANDYGYTLVPVLYSRPHSSVMSAISSLLK